MKLIRFGEFNSEKAGVELEDGKRIDVSSEFTFDKEFFDNDGLNKLEQYITNNAETLPEVPSSTRLGSPIERPGKVICVGLNYIDHVKESGAETPTEPVLFFKSTTSVCGPNDNVVIPRRSVKTDWEVELGVIIGTTVKYIESKEKALDYIGGYCISHDVSEREFQLEHEGQWCKGKSFDNFNPLGPWLVTKDEITDPFNLNLKCWVNDKLYQNGNSSLMIFDVAYLVWYISQFMTLEAGDVITTGTPPGVGLGQNPQVYLKSGDKVALEIDGLGRQEQAVVAEES